MLIIGIAGGSGSGKTTVVKALTDQLKERVVVIPQDSYYKDSSHLPMEERQKVNFDHPDSIDFDLLVRHLKELKAGRSIEQPVYSYITCSRSKTETITVNPAEVIIVEGILIFCCAELRNQMDIKSFVDAGTGHHRTRKDRGDRDSALFAHGKADVPPIYRAEQEVCRRDYPAGRSQQGGNRRYRCDNREIAQFRSLTGGLPCDG